MEIPKYLEPTNKTNIILATLFIGIMILGLFQFPLGKIMAGQTDVQFRVGWPVPFLILDFENSDRNPFLIIGVLADLLFYLVIAYWTDILLTSTWKGIKTILKIDIKQKNRK
jgi:hypothetical protein